MKISLVDSDLMGFKGALMRVFSDSMNYSWDLMRFFSDSMEFYWELIRWYRDSMEYCWDLIGFKEFLASSWIGPTSLANGWCYVPDFWVTRSRRWSWTYTRFDTQKMWISGIFIGIYRFIPSATVCNCDKSESPVAINSPIFFHGGCRAWNLSGP